jgi:hypothetical protein
VATRYGIAMTRAPEAGVPLGRIETPRLVYAVIVLCTAVAAFLRLYLLTRPGYLLGVTEYDDAVQFGDALKLVNGVIPYRDFVVLQPPGSFLLMTPVALLAKVTGSATGLGIARVLTACADTACVALLGLLVRHRGPVAAGIACGIYAVYPDALVAAHTFLLEPWLNLFCLIAALLVFDADRITHGRRLAGGGVVFGLAVAIKIWALIPLGVLGLLLLRRPRRLALLAGGAAAGLAVPVLPFLVLAPGRLVHDVIVTQFNRASVAHTPPLPRLVNLAGLSVFPDLSGGLRIVLMLAIAAIVPVGYLAACQAGARRPTALDWYALISAVAVIGMLLWPYDYWFHYGAFAGVFIALVFALPTGLLRPAEHSSQMVPLIAVSVVAAVVIAAFGTRQLAAETRLRAWSTSANRFTSDAAGCPSLVDSSGTLLALTDGRGLEFGSPQQLHSVTALWRSAFSRARYIWIESSSQRQIPWTPALYAYFTSHFKLIGLVNGPGAGNAPEGGLYVRR